MRSTNLARSYYCALGLEKHCPPRANCEERVERGHIKQAVIASYPRLGRLPDFDLNSYTVAEYSVLVCLPVRLLHLSFGRLRRLYV